MLTSIAAAVAVLALLIVVHEAGHFVIAKRLGVRVLRFSIGYPPKVWGIRRGETEYAFGATPLGGYVRMLGEEIGEEPRSEELRNYVRELALDVLGTARTHDWHPVTRKPEEAIVALAKQLAAAGPGNAATILGRELTPEEMVVMNEIARQESLERAQTLLGERVAGPVLRSFQNRAFPTQKLWKRVVIVLAGPLSNILFAPILMTVVFLYGVPAVLPTIGKVDQHMPAYAAGIRSGDKVLSVDGMRVWSWNDFSDAVKSSQGKTLKIELERAPQAQHLTLLLKPKREEEPTIYGTKAMVWVIGVLPRGDETTMRYGPFGALERGIIGSVQLTRTLIVGIAQIVEGVTPVRQALGGPIMIAQLAGREAREGLANLLMFTVMLSLELGFINLLPVPLLDGGHLLFFVFEGIRGEPLKLRHREIALQVGLFLLVALMAFVIFNDISRVARG